MTVGSNLQHPNQVAHSSKSQYFPFARPGTRKLPDPFRPVYQKNLLKSTLKINRLYQFIIFMIYILSIIIMNLLTCVGKNIDPDFNLLQKIIPKAIKLLACLAEILLQTRVEGSIRIGG